MFTFEQTCHQNISFYNQFLIKFEFSNRNIISFGTDQLLETFVLNLQKKKFKNSKVET